MNTSATKKYRSLIILFVIALMAMAGLTACGNNSSSLLTSKGDSYFIYVGLIDADSGLQEVSAANAEKTIQTTLMEHKQGASVLPVWGGFKDDNGEYKTNDTILVIVNCAEDIVEDMINEWKTSFNLASVYVEKYNMNYGMIGGQR